MRYVPSPSYKRYLPNKSCKYKCKLLYVSRCIRGSRVFLDRMLSTLRNAGTASRIRPDEGFYWDLQWFLQFLKIINGVGAFNCPPFCHTAFLDAILQRLGGIWASHAYLINIPFMLFGEFAITQYEMYNILVAVKLWASHWKDMVNFIWCDNGSAVMVCNTGRTRVAFLGACLQNAIIDLYVIHIGVETILWLMPYLVISCIK